MGMFFAGYVLVCTWARLGMGWVWPCKGLGIGSAVLGYASSVVGLDCAHHGLDWHWLGFAGHLLGMGFAGLGLGLSRLRWLVLGLDWLGLGWSLGELCLGWSGRSHVWAVCDLGVAWPDLGRAVHRWAGLGLG
jgi:hypothetical protein